MTESALGPPRSWLFAPGHNEKLLAKVFDADADAVLLDLEDAVPPDAKDRARALVKEVATGRRCWVRVNQPLTSACEQDLEALAGVVAGFRVPKVEGASDVAWVADRAPGILLDCTIESAKGVMGAFEIASSVSCALLSYGGIDLAADLDIDGGPTETLFARSSIVVSARAAGKPAPSDGIHPYVDDEIGLRQSAEAARQLGFFGKSAIHPRQVPIINQVFSPTDEQIVWANRVLEAFDAASGNAVKLADGEFVDLAVAKRARQILQIRRRIHE
jgi:citrate lyase subunit beta / citryl-CoA lyase